MLFAQFRQGAADFRLEYYDHGDRQVDRQALQQPVQLVEMDQVRQEQHAGDEQHQARQHLRAPRAAEEQDDVIDHHREHQDLDQAADPG